MKTKTLEAIDTFINGNITDARKYFKNKPSELSDKAKDLARLCGGNTVKKLKKKRKKQTKTIEWNTAYSFPRRSSSGR